MGICDEQDHIDFKELRLRRIQKWNSQSDRVFEWDRANKQLTASHHLRDYKITSLTDSSYLQEAAAAPNPTERKQRKEFHRKAETQSVQFRSLALKLH